MPAELSTSIHLAERLRLGIVLISQRIDHPTHDAFVAPRWDWEDDRFESPVSSGFTGYSERRSDDS
jgi:hypothetical protein